MTTAKQMAERNSANLDSLAVTVKALAGRVNTLATHEAETAQRLRALAEKVDRQVALAERDSRITRMGRQVDIVDSRAAAASTAVTAVCARVTELEEQAEKQPAVCPADLQSLWNAVHKLEEQMGRQIDMIGVTASDASDNAATVCVRVDKLEARVGDIKTTAGINERHVDAIRAAAADKRVRQVERRHDWSMAGLGMVAGLSIAMVIAFLL